MRANLGAVLHFSAGDGDLARYIRDILQAATHDSAESDSLRYQSPVFGVLAF